MVVGRIPFRVDGEDFCLADAVAFGHSIYGGGVEGWGDMGLEAVLFDALGGRSPSYAGFY